MAHLLIVIGIWCRPLRPLPPSSPLESGSPGGFRGRFSCRSRSVTGVPSPSSSESLLNPLHHLHHLVDHVLVEVEVLAGVPDDHRKLEDLDPEVEDHHPNGLPLGLLLSWAVREAAYAGGGGPFERILLRTTPMLGTRCAAAGEVLVRNRLLTGTTMVLLPLFLLLRFMLPADAPRESPGE